TGLSIAIQAGSSGEAGSSTGAQENRNALGLSRLSTDTGDTGSVDHQPAGSCPVPRAGLPLAGYHFRLDRADAVAGHSRSWGSLPNEGRPRPETCGGLARPRSDRREGAAMERPRHLYEVWPAVADDDGQIRADPRGRNSGAPES